MRVQTFKKTYGSGSTDRCRLVEIGGVLIRFLLLGEEAVMDDRVGRRHHLRRVLGGVQFDELGLERPMAEAAVDLVRYVGHTRAAVAAQEQRHDHHQGHVLALADSRILFLLFAGRRLILSCHCTAVAIVYGFYLPIRYAVRSR